MVKVPSREYQPIEHCGVIGELEGFNQVVMSDVESLFTTQ
jgi:hypothetical protein